MLRRLPRSAACGSLGDRRAGSFPLPKVLQPGFRLGDLLAKLVDGLLHVRHVVRELPLGAMIPEQLDLAEADLRCLKRRRRWQGRDRLGLGT